MRRSGLASNRAGRAGSLVIGHSRSRQCVEQSEKAVTMGEGAARELPDDERMTEHEVFVEQLGERMTLASQVVHPDRRVGQRHRPSVGGRRRGAGRRSFSLPPRAARRRALSRAMSASSPRRTRAVFSLTPVSRAARRIRLSSTLRVVLICINMHGSCAFVNRRGGASVRSVSKPRRRCPAGTSRTSSPEYPAGYTPRCCESSARHRRKLSLRSAASAGRHEAPTKAVRRPV